MTMTKILSRTTCYTYGHGPLKVLPQMGENAHFKNGHARVETRVLRITSVSKWFLDLFLILN